MQPETAELSAARDILDDLYTQLGDAIASWSRLTQDEQRDEQLYQSQCPEHARLRPAAHEVPLRGSGRQFDAPSLNDPAIGAESRYWHQWKGWMEGPTISNPSTALDLSPNTQWWMQEQDHYGLLQLREQGQLESAARVAQFHRNHAPAQTHRRSFAQEVQIAQQRQALAAVPRVGRDSEPPRSHRRARNNSEDFWLDEDYDPQFWQKNSRSGNIWTNQPQPQLPDDSLSPRTRQPARWRS